MNTEITEYEVYTESEEKVNNSIQSARVVLKYSTNQDSKVNEINYLIEKSEGGYKISPDTIMTPKGYNVSFDVPTGSSLKIGDRVIDDNFRNEKNKDVYDLQQLFYGDYPMEYVADDIQGNPTKEKISWSLFGVSSDPKIDTKDWMLTDAGKSKAKEEANSSITKINEYLLNDLSENDAVTILGGEENSMLKYNLKSLKSNNPISKVAISDEEAYLNSDGLFVVPFIQTVTEVKKEIEDPFGLNSTILEKYKETFPYTLNWELIFKKDQGKLKIVGIERRGD
ncbi:hypothetical protein [Eubacterium aggregans]|uniref:hypothetical protein n=1 Tax=Eubacterium aggregans TaxID=81409 RepID=UPI003F3CD9D3